MRETCGSQLHGTDSVVANVAQITLSQPANVSSLSLGGTALTVFAFSTLTTQTFAYSAGSLSLQSNAQMVVSSTTVSGNVAINGPGSFTTRNTVRAAVLCLFLRVAHADIVVLCVSQIEVTAGNAFTISGANLIGQLITLDTPSSGLVFTNGASAQVGNWVRLSFFFLLACCSPLC